MLSPSVPSLFVQQHMQVNPSHESLATAAVMGQSVSGARVYDDNHSSQHHTHSYCMCAVASKTLRVEDTARAGEWH